MLTGFTQLQLHLCKRIETCKAVKTEDFTEFKTFSFFHA